MNPAEIEEGGNRTVVRAERVQPTTNGNIDDGTLTVAGVVRCSEGIRKGDISDIRELEDGFAFKFRHSGSLTRRIADYLLFEGQHSPYLNFVLVVEPNSSAFWLQVEGPGNAKDQIKITYLQHRIPSPRKVSEQ